MAALPAADVTLEPPSVALSTTPLDSTVVATVLVDSALASPELVSVAVTEVTSVDSPPAPPVALLSVAVVTVATVSDVVTVELGTTVVSVVDAPPSSEETVLSTTRVCSVTMVLEVIC